MKERFLAMVRVSDGCWTWTGTTHPDGYGIVYLGRANSVLAHRASWELHNGPIPKGMSVLHRCDNPPCVNPAHLFLGSQADNVADRHAKGRTPHGERHYRARLTAEQVLEIRASSELTGALAKRLGVTKRHVRKIRQGLTWKGPPIGTQSKGHPMSKDREER